jgi:hypothetical protein
MLTVERVSDENAGAVGQRSMENTVFEDRFANEGVHGAEGIIKEDDVGIGVRGTSERYAGLVIDGQYLERRGMVVARLLSTRHIDSPLADLGSVLA